MITKKKNLNYIILIDHKYLVINGRTQLYFVYFMEYNLVNYSR